MYAAMGVTRAFVRHRRRIVRPEGTTGECACRATASFHVLREILQMLVILGQNRQNPLGTPSLATPLSWPLLSQQPGNRLLISSNHQHFAHRKVFDQVR